MGATCLIQGDGDLYGLGVRLGLYFQWAAGFLLRNFSGSWKTISTVRLANNTLGISLVLATMINTCRGLSQVTDFLIVYYLAIALFYSESYNLLKRQDTSEKGYYYSLRPDMPLLLQNLLFAATSLFGGWFWIHGISKTLQPPCGAKAAVIGSFDMNSTHWKTFAATFSIMLGVVFAFFFVVHLYGFWRGEVKRQPVAYIAKVLNFVSGHPDMFKDMLKAILRPDLINIKRNSPIAELSCNSTALLFQFIVVNLLGPIIAITSVEHMIRANHLSTASIPSSSGQMIALITGTTSLCLAVWELGKSYLERKRALPRDIASFLLYNSTKPMDLDELKEYSKQLFTWISQYDRDDAWDECVSDFRHHENVGDQPTPHIAILHSHNEPFQPRPQVATSSSAPPSLASPRES